MYKGNLLKSGYVLVNADEVRVIDSDKRIKINSDEKNGPQDGQIQDVSAYMPASFDEEQIQPELMDALFGELPQEGMEENEEGAQDFHQMADPQILQQANSVIDDANRQAQEIVEQAIKQAQEEAQRALADAKEQGYQAGYEEGRNRLEQEYKQKLQELDQMELQRRHKFDDMVSEMEPYLVRELTGIYEHFIGVELSQYKNVLSHLISNTLHSTQSSDTYLIHVSPQDYSYVSMQKTSLMEENGMKNVSMEVVEDVTLSKNECLIETDTGIFDCSLAVQMEELKRKLTLLSYHKE